MPHILITRFVTTSFETGQPCRGSAYLRNSSNDTEKFKSYGGVYPFEDFICMVGSNGADKANLMSAISFVVGFNLVNFVPPT